MGYSSFFYKASKSLINELKNCKTYKEVVDVCIKYNLEVDEEDNYCFPDNFGKIVYDFGKDYGNITAINNTGVPLFEPNSEASKAYIDFNIHIANKESIKCAIEFYKNKIIENYTDLLSEKSADLWDKRNQFDRMKDHIEYYLYTWNHSLVYNLDNNNDTIVNGWLIEHRIFELIRLYKTFDFETYELLFMGW